MKLDREKIVNSLDDKTIQQINAIEIFDEISSTNTWLLDNQACATVCLAERQSQGRGRRGRQWVSSDAGNLYLSLGWCFDTNPANLSLAGLLTGIAVCDALESLGIESHGVKWPNDIVAKDKKLGGILLETRAPSAYLVTGIGLNVQMTSAEGIDQPWTSLQQITALEISRNRLAAAVIQHTVSAMLQLQSLDLIRFRSRWQRWNILAGRVIKVLDGDKITQGRMTDIDCHGRLVLELDDGSTRIFSSAEITVRW